MIPVSKIANEDRQMICLRPCEEKMGLIGEQKSRVNSENIQSSGASIQAEKTEIIQVQFFGCINQSLNT